MAAPKTEAIGNRQFTVAEYLAFERASDTRHEFRDGEILAMAGESEAHGEICANVFGELYLRLKDSRCRLRTKDTKVRSGFAPPKRKKGLFSYPDIVVICDDPEYMDEHRDILLNPKIIIEVLSESTAGFDKEGKFLRYQMWLPSLTDYVLIEQTAPFILHYHRIDADRWEAQRLHGLDKTLELASVACRISLSEIYHRVEFPPPVEEEESDDPDLKETAP
jgi:Uma2 family endonuclease